MNHPHLKKILEENPSFRIGHYISRGFAIFSSHFGNFVGFSLLSVFMMFFIGGIPLFGKWASELVIAPVLTAGIYLVAHRIHKGERVEFSDHFMGFQHWIRLGLASVTLSILFAVATIPFFIANIELLDWIGGLREITTFDTNEIMGVMDGNPGFDSWKLLLLIPVLYLMVAYSWTKMFIIFYDLKVWEAMEASRQLISKNWITYLLFIITLGIIGFGGLAGFIIGVFFTYPAMLCINYVAFEDMTQLKKAESDEDFVDVLVK